MRLRPRGAFILMGFFALGIGLSQSKSADPVNAIYAAQRYIAVITPLLEQENLAKALHYALTKRGVAVFVVHEYATVESPAAYTGSLALAGAKIRLLRGVPSPTRVLVDGSALIEWEAGGMGKPLKMTKNPQTVRAFLGEFNRAYLRGVEYTYRVKLPPGYVALEEHPINDLISMAEKSAVDYIRFIKELGKMDLNQFRRQ